ncbi:hypothetical protein FOA52_003721 [Chlamydomonas sp. UWO 241]|nr:hypothetical protein FOA52_003721 [Chlamydomonas sp. UWO 241]
MSSEIARGVSGNTPARAVIAHGDVTLSGVTNEQATSPVEHVSPMPKRKRQHAKAADTEGTVCFGGEFTGPSTLLPAPSGRGEVGGPMIPAGGERAIASCLGDSVAPAEHAEGGAMETASVHMGQNLQGATRDASGSNEQVGDGAGEQQSKPAGARGRPKSARLARRDGGNSLSVVSPVDGGASAECPVSALVSGTDSVKRGARGAGARAKAAASRGGGGSGVRGKAEAAGENEGAAEGENDGGVGGADDDKEMLSEDEGAAREGKRARTTRAAGAAAAATSAAAAAKEGQGGNEEAAAENELAGETHRRTTRARPPRPRGSEAGGCGGGDADAALPEVSFAEAPDPNRSTVGGGSSGSGGHPAVSAEGPHVSAAHASGAFVGGAQGGTGRDVQPQPNVSGAGSFRGGEVDAGARSAEGTGSKCVLEGAGSGGQPLEGTAEA